jgi:hypothetical protein
MRACVSLAVAIVVTGCMGPSMSVGARIPSSRLVAMPAVGDAFSLTGDGSFVANDRLAALAAPSINDSINYRLHVHGVRLFDWDVIRQLPNEHDFVEWSVHSMQEIMAENLGKGYRSHDSVGQFRYRGDLGAWRRKLAGDYLLVSYFIIGYDARDRSAFAATHAARRALACIVDLSGGQMVWCRYTDIGMEVVLTRDGAQDVVDRLLEAMLARGDRVDRGQ